MARSMAPSSPKPSPQIVQKYPDAVTAERIVFMKGKVDRKRETPSIMVSEIIPVEEAIGRLTTSVVLDLDRTRHNPDVITQLKPLLTKYKGMLPVFSQIVIETGEQVLIKLGRANDIGLRPSRPMLDDLELLLGPGQIQLHGAGSKRQRIRQEKLFKEDTPEEAIGPGTSDETVAAQLDAEMEQAD